MTFTQTIQALKDAGTAQNRKIYGRHGVKREMYGVSYKVFGELKKKIKTDHALAEKLWATQIHDPMILACMIADPAAIRLSTINTWAKESENGVENDAFAKLVAQTPHAFKKANQWMKAKSERIASLGWNVLSKLAVDRYDADWAPYIDHIEQHIYDAPNDVRYSMNNALICIGVIDASLKKQALAAAKRIGTVEVDHGQTSCKTPAAGPYIEKTWAHQQRKKK